jgi:hypothetical protein
LQTISQRKARCNAQAVAEAACSERNVGRPTRNRVPGEQGAFLVKGLEVFVGQKPLGPEGDVESASSVAFGEHELVRFGEPAMVQDHQGVQARQIAAEVADFRVKVHAQEPQSGAFQQFLHLHRGRDMDCVRQNTHWQLIGKKEPIR